MSPFLQAGSDIDRLNRPRHLRVWGWEPPRIRTGGRAMTETEDKLRSNLWKALKDDHTVMLGLAGVEEGHSQPMAAQIPHDADEHGPIWFFTTKDNDLVK